MGYYTTISVDLAVKEEKIEAFYRKLEEMRSVTDPVKQWFRCYSDLTVDENGAIQFEDNYRKWYGEEEFYNFVKEYVTSGEIVGYGDEFEDYWKIVFDGNGNWKRQIPKFVDEDTQEQPS